MALDDPTKDLLAEIKGEIKATYADLDKKHSDVAELLGEIKKKVEGKADTTDLDGRLKTLGEEIKKVSTLADTLDTKLSRPGGASTSEAALSAGQRIAQAAEVKQWAKDRGGRVVWDAKAIITSDVTVGGQTLTPGAPRTMAPLVTIPDETLTVRDLIPSGTTTSNAIEYPRELTSTLNAAIVPEGQLKPESLFDLTLETAPIVTIAHWFQVSKQILDDLGMLQGYIDGRLRFGLALAEDRQLLLGTGAGGQMNGILTQAALFPASVAVSGIPGGQTAQQVDVVRWAKLLVRQAQYPATAVVLNPEDWARIELLKDADARYIYSAFQQGAEPRLWGMRVVESDGIAAGTFLVGAFQLGAQLWDREQANVVLSTEDRDNFIRNMVTIRGEERLGLTVFRPQAFVRGSFTLAA